MKKILITWFLTSFHIILFAQIKTISLQASGLTCSMCSNAIHKALKTIPFVANVETNIDESSFKLSILPNKNVDFEIIKNKVVGAGFFISQFKLNAILNEESILKHNYAEIDDLKLYLLHKPSLILSEGNEFYLVHKNYLSDKTFKKYESLIEQEKSKSSSNNQADIGKKIYYLIDSLK